MLLEQIASVRKLRKLNHHYARKANTNREVEGSAFGACFANVRGSYWRENLAALRQYVRDGKAINNRRPDAIAEKAFQLRHDTY